MIEPTAADGQLRQYTRFDVTVSTATPAGCGVAVSLRAAASNGSDSYR
jgi:hypothetical protein